MQAFFAFVLSGKLSTHDLLAKIRVPTLVLAGREDRVHSIDESRELQQQIPGAGWAELEGAGHVPSFTHPDEFEAQVLSFVRSVAARPISQPRLDI
jgi:pimeloyl-ACP methyl ester carboxylesterase